MKQEQNLYIKRSLVLFIQKKEIKKLMKIVDL